MLENKEDRNIRVGDSKEGEDLVVEDPPKNLLRLPPIEASLEHCFSFIREFYFWKQTEKAGGASFGSLPKIKGVHLSFPCREEAKCPQTCAVVIETLTFQELLTVSYETYFL